MSTMLPVRRDWALRVIPLPHEMHVTGEVEVPPDQIGLAWDGLGTPLDAVTRRALGEVTPHGARGDWVIRPRLAGSVQAADLSGVASRLTTLPNADQAYAVAIRPLRAGGEVSLIATSPLGLLYAARTLAALCRDRGAERSPTMVLPVGSIVDWPDIGERGQWGGNTETELPAMAALKLNAWPVHAWPGVDESGTPRIRLEAATVSGAALLGIQAVPIFIHLEQLSTQGMKGWEDCYNVPDAERAGRSDYVPGLCLSSPRTRELIAELLRLVAALPGARGVDFCLSEEWTACLCPRCAGREPFLLEVEAVLEAYRRVKSQHPSLHLRVETSQGSHEVNDRILALLPADVGVQYYDGGRTYSSTHKPIIPPLFAEYTRAGGWLGVCAQITNSWRSTLPWTGPQFVHARMNEFADKGLSYFIGYAVPANHFHEHNVAAAAEWSWNRSGRSPREFARAFAMRQGVADPDLYADWAILLGPVGWDIAATRLYLSLIYDPSFGADKGVPFDHRFEGGPEVLDEESIAQDLRNAGQAMEIALRLDLPEAVEETEIDIASLHLLRTLYALSHVEGASPGSPLAATAAVLLETLDRCAAVVSTRLRSWGERISSRKGLPMPSRLCDTMQAVPRAANLARQRLGCRLGIADPYPHHRYQEIGRWSTKDFAAASRRTLTFGATPVIREPGEYAICLDFLPGLHGLTARNLSVVETRDGKRRNTFGATDLLERVSMWVKSAEVTVTIDRVEPGACYKVELDAEGPPVDADHEKRSCNGVVSLRRHWPRRSPGFPVVPRIP